MGIARCVLLVLLLSACALGRGVPDPEFLSSPEFAAQGLPFSEAVRAGDVLYLSGQLGTLPGSLELTAGGIRAEARQALENVRAVLERNGSSLDRVVKCSVFLAEMDQWAAFNEVYVEYLPQRPARSAFAAAGLAFGASLELECIALVERR